MRGDASPGAAAAPTQRPKSRRARRGPTLRDVAQRAGVSNMTVSRVINRERGVGPDKRALVERAMRELNYFPNLAAQALAKTQLTDKIALLFDTRDVTALGEMVSIGSDEAARLNVKLVFVRVRREDDPIHTLETLENLGIRGVLLSAPLCDDTRLRVVLREAGMRFVAVGSSDSDPGLSSIGIDDARAAYDLTRYLLQLGHRRIGFIAGNPRHCSSAQRRAGHEAALIEQGIKPDKALQWEAPYTFDSSIAAADALALQPRVTAIVASNDDMAAAVIHMAIGRGIAVPRSLTVCGFDDGEAVLMTCPRLTMVRRPIAKMVSWGIRQLFEELVALSRGEEPLIQNTVVDHAIAYQESDAPPERAGISPFGLSAQAR
ncbi:LacI family transcriptional regulator [Sphingomonas sp. LB-2]|nr:LacI family transcriptional regulator [Sphingomonas caeni]